MHSHKLRTLEPLLVPTGNAQVVLSLRITSSQCQKPMKWLRVSSKTGNGSFSPVMSNPQKNFLLSHYFHITGEYYPSFPSNSTRPVILRKKMTWESLLSYFQTWSSLHTYLERYPEDRQHPEGNVSVRFWNKLKGAASKDDEVEVEWPVAMILVKKA
jgi:hypothetical protein